MPPVPTRLGAALLAFALLIAPALADDTPPSVGSYRELQTLIEGFGDDALPHTLLVMDDDDTLTMMHCPDQADAAHCQYLGGPAWYAWQESLLGTRSPYRVAERSQDLLDIATLVFAMNRMAYTDPDTADVLAHLAGRGVHLLVLTARGPETLSATAAQLDKLSVTPTPDTSTPNTPVTLLDWLADHAPKGSPGGTASLASPFQPCARRDARPVSYQQGVMYVAGQDKGDMLRCLLGATDAADIRHIVFIDDTPKNVVAVRQAFENDPDRQVTARHYTRLEAHKDALTEGPMARVYQNNATVRWGAIRRALESRLQDPALPPRP